MSRAPPKPYKPAPRTALKSKCMFKANVKGTQAQSSISVSKQVHRFCPAMYTSNLSCLFSVSPSEISCAKCYLEVCRVMDELLDKTQHTSGGMWCLSFILDCTALIAHHFGRVSLD